MNEKLTPVDACSVSVNRGAGQQETAGAQGHYDIVCRGSNGEIKWVDEIENAVMDEGKAFLLDNALAGSSYTTPGPKMSLVTNSGFTAFNTTDSYRGGAGTLHAGWAESTVAGATRAAVTWASAIAGSKAANSVTFSITGSDTIKGCALFLTTSTVLNENVASDSTHRLLSAGLFTGGDKTVGNTDTITVTYTFSI